MSLAAKPEDAAISSVAGRRRLQGLPYGSSAGQPGTASQQYLRLCDAGPAVADACSGFHTAPTNLTLAGITAQCSSCHTQTTWAATAIDHTRFFALTDPHDLACTSCDTTADDFKKYTCFSSHLH